MVGPPKQSFTQSVPLSWGTLWQFSWTMSQNCPWKFVEWVEHLSTNLFSPIGQGLPHGTLLTPLSYPLSLTLLPSPAPNFNLAYVSVPSSFLWALSWKECPNPKTGSERPGVVGEALFSGTCAKPVDTCTQLITVAMAGIRDLKWCISVHYLGTFSQGERGTEIHPVRAAPLWRKWLTSLIYTKVPYGVAWSHMSWSHKWKTLNTPHTHPHTHPDTLLQLIKDFSKVAK